MDENVIDEIGEIIDGFNGSAGAEESECSATEPILEEPNLLDLWQNNQGSLVIRTVMDPDRGRQVSITWLPDDPNQEPVRQTLTNPDLDEEAFNDCVDKYVRNNEHREPNAFKLHVEAGANCWLSYFE